MLLLQVVFINRSQLYSKSPVIRAYSVLLFQLASTSDRDTALCLAFLTGYYLDFRLDIALNEST